ncbi:MAG TPA: hypothetical protein VGP73_27970 [Thermoanaerobaculia bacterium]
MSRETTYAGMVGDWQKLLVTLEANIAEIPSWSLSVRRSAVSGYTPS